MGEAVKKTRVGGNNEIKNINFQKKYEFSKPLFHV